MIAPERIERSLLRVRQSHAAGRDLRRVDRHAVSRPRHFVTARRCYGDASFRRGRARVSAGNGHDDRRVVPEGGPPRRSARRAVRGPRDRTTDATRARAPGGGVSRIDSGGTAASRPASARRGLDGAPHATREGDPRGRGAEIRAHLRAGGVWRGRAREDSEYGYITGTFLISRRTHEKATYSTTPHFARAGARQWYRHVPPKAT